MSRIGKQPISIPDKAQITVEGNNVKTKGPLGELDLDVPEILKVTKTESELKLEIAKKRTEGKAIWGLYRSLLANIILGVTEGFEKVLEIEGVGYRAELKDKDLILHLGYSHPIIMPIPEGLKVELEKNKIKISGINNQELGQFAADIRKKRKPEPYKGKGIRYEGEYVRRKVGKRAAGGPGA